MNPGLTSAVGTITVIASVVALLLGYLSERNFFNAFLVGVLTAASGGLCMLGLHLIGWPGLVIAIVLDTLAAYRIGKGVGKERGAVFVTGLFLGTAGSCAIGYWAGGWLGLLTITVPSWLVFWGGLYYVSGHLLPLQDRSQRRKAFRALFTYSLGTNFPYHAMEDRELKQRVPGNPYGQMFAGPGIVLTGPAHAPIIWDGIDFKFVGEPGLTFTGRFQTIFQVVDLRPQLRSFFVEAITRDGIRVRILTFIPFKLYSQPSVPEFGGSFPMDKDAIQKAVWTQPIDKGRGRIPWDELAPVMAERLMRKIISRYDCDELCEPHYGDSIVRPDAKKLPRIKIRNELIDQLKEEMKACGIELVGGGISNIVPMKQAVIDQRIEAWRADWEKRIQTIMGEAQAYAVRSLERVHTHAQARLIGAMGTIATDLKASGMGQGVLPRLAALRFIEALEEIAYTPDVQEMLPAGGQETIAYLKNVVTKP